MTDEDFAWYDAQVDLTANQYARRYYGYADKDDIHSILWEWILRHKAKIARWRKENDEKGFERVFGFTLSDTANIFCRKEKAAKLGYNVQDEFFYTKAVIEDLLPVVFNKEEWLNPPVEHEASGRSQRALNEGNNWVTTLADISRAFDLLEKKDRDWLLAIYRDGVTRMTLAKDNDIARKTVDSREEAAIKRLWRLLGGPRWLHAERDNVSDSEPAHQGRKAISNAAARARTENQWSPS